MWIMTNEGFLSIVEKPWDRPYGTLTVRARTIEDIDFFLAVCQERRDADGRRPFQFGGRIEEDPAADYRFRIQVPRASVRAYVDEMIVGIDYDNFKNSVKNHGHHKHAVAYSGVWSVLRHLQEDEEEHDDGQPDDLQEHQDFAQDDVYGPAPAEEIAL